MSKKGTGTISLRGAVAVDTYKNGVKNRMQVKNGKLYAEGISGGIDATAGIKNLLSKGYTVNTVTKKTLEKEKKAKAAIEKEKTLYDAQGGGSIGGKLRRAKRTSDRVWKKRGG